MGKDFAFMFYPGDYLRDTQCLSEKVQVAYDRIMCEHMRNILITQDQLKFFTKRLSEDEISELLLVLTKCDAGYQISWVADSIAKRQAYSESRAKNREGKKHKLTHKKTSKTYVPHMEDEYKDIIIYLNKVAGTKFIPEAESNLKFISARMKNYKAEDLKRVIDVKTAEWKGTDQEKYLRPETLFNATKFEGYVNQKPREAKEVCPYTPEQLNDFRAKLQAFGSPGKDFDMKWIKEIQ